MRRILSKRPVSAVTFILLAVLCAQAQPDRFETRRNQRGDPGKSTSSASVIENEEIKMLIPSTWKISKNEPGKVVLEKDDYTLSLAYHTMHASGIFGGRFIELLQVPWLDDIDQQWACSFHLTKHPYPANRKLIFVNLVIRSGEPETREKCGLTRDLGYWSAQDGGQTFVGHERWFAGYFTTSDGGWFFYSKQSDAKAFTLTHTAKTPEGLPLTDSPRLQNIIQEAIDIVNSIRYKRHAPVARRLVSR